MMGPKASVSELAAVLSDTDADSALEVFRRIQAADALGVLGSSAASAIPALIRTLTVRVALSSNSRPGTKSWGKSG